MRPLLHESGVAERKFIPAERAADTRNGVGRRVAYQHAAGYAADARTALLEIEMEDETPDGAAIVRWCRPTALKDLRSALDLNSGSVEKVLSAPDPYSRLAEMMAFGLDGLNAESSTAALTEWRQRALA